MAQWSKIKFFYDTMLGSTGSTLTATSTASGGYSVNYLYNMLETNMWKAANTTDPHYLTYDAGAGNVKTADCLAILGHNLSSAGASAVLQCSADNFATSMTVIAKKAVADAVIFEEARILVNGDFETWTNGTSVAPDGWIVLNGTVARDSANVKSGSSSAKLTGWSSVSYLYQDRTALWLPYLKGKTITFGCWVKTSGTNPTPLVIWDGVTVTYGPAYSGGGNWQFLTVSAVIAANATILNIDCSVQPGQTSYFDGAILKEGSSMSSSDASDPIQPGALSYRYWRLKLSGMSAPPYMTLCVWGNKTELDYADASFDPYGQDVKANVNLSQGGYVTGVHTAYVERMTTLTFEDADSTLYNKVKSWWEASGLKNFFVAWETANSPSDVFLMRPDTKFSNPLTNGGLYRSITINLKGRKE